MTSVALPGACAMTMRSGLPGQVCARTELDMKMRRRIQAIAS